MLLVFVILLICEISGLENNTGYCNYICDCEDDLMVKFNKAKASTGSRRGLFDDFPKNRFENKSYYPKDSKTNDNVGMSPHYFEVIFVSTFVVVAAIIQHLIIYYKIKLPYETFILLLSVIAGILSKLYPTFDSYTFFANMDPNLVIRMFLPSIIVYTVYSIDFYIMTKCIYQVVILGIAGFTMRCVFIGVVMVIIINQSQNWETFFMFGAMCTITQPKEALRVLKTVGEFKHITALLEAESLLSLSLGIFVYNVISTSVNHSNTFFIACWYYSFISIFLGVSIGWMTYFVLKWINVEGRVFIYIVLSVSYLVFEMASCFSSVTCLLSFLWILHRMKSALSPTDDSVFDRMIEACGFISNTMILVMTGIMVTENILVAFKKFEVLEIIGAFITYFVTYIARFAVLFFLLPVLRKVGYYIPWQHMLIIGVSGFRGSFALCIALTAKQDKNLSMYNSTFLLCTSVLVLLSVIINPLCLTYAIKKLGLNQVDDAKVNNMSAILKNINKKKRSVITALKANNEYSETNWIVVDNFTTIKYPYSSAEDSDVMENCQQRKSSIVCPICKKDHNQKRTSFEINTEANRRILQIKKINFRRQYNEGLLNIHELRLLEGAIDHASDTKNKILNLKSMKNLWVGNWFLEKFRLRLLVLVFWAKQKYIQPPLNRFHYKIYSIVTLKYYDAVIFICNFLSLLPIVYKWYYQSRIDEKNVAIEILLDVAYVIFFFLFLADILMKLCAMGWRQYFRFWWSGVEIGLILISILDFGIEIHSLATVEFHKPFLLNEMNICLKTVRVIYFLRIIDLIQLIIPRILMCIDNSILVDKLSGYNIAQCVIKTQEEIIKYIQYMSETEGSSFEVELRETSQRFEVQKDIGSTQSDFPLVSITVKTKHAIQVILNNMKWHLDNLKEKGIIDDMESKHFTEMFKEKNSELNRKGLVPSPLPGVAIRGIPWIGGDQGICNYLYECAELLWYQPGDEILSSGENPKGLYIILSGQATSSYNYSKTAYDDHKYYGLLPNCDFLMHLTYDNAQKHDDVLYPGTRFGEIGVLTDRPYNYTVMCTSVVMVSFINKEKLQKAFKIYKNLELQMWKAVAIKVASLKSYLPFQTLHIDTLKSKLQNGNMYVLSNCLSLELNKFPGYIFLLEGTMEDKASNLVYIAPTYFAETSQILTYFNVLVNEDIKSQNEEFETINKKKVDIKILVIGEFVENVKYAVVDGGSGNYRLIEDQISMLCERHKNKPFQEVEGYSLSSNSTDESYDESTRPSIISRLFKPNKKHRASNTSFEE